MKDYSESTLEISAALSRARQYLIMRDWDKALDETAQMSAAVYELQRYLVHNLKQNDE